jgi:hypothetical protein
MGTVAPDLIRLDNPACPSPRCGRIDRAIRIDHGIAANPIQVPEILACAVLEACDCGCQLSSQASLLPEFRLPFALRFVEQSFNKSRDSV